MRMALVTAAAMSLPRFSVPAVALGGKAHPRGRLHMRKDMVVISDYTEILPMVTLV